MNIILKDRLIKKRRLLKSIIFLRIKANSAISGPPIGPTLGQYGIPAAPFCKLFNERTENLLPDVELEVTIFLLITGEYRFNIHLPVLTFFIKRGLSIGFANSRPGYVLTKPGHASRYNKKLSNNILITRFIMYEIFLYKEMTDEHYLDIKFKQLLSRSKGTLKSMGIHIYMAQ